MAENGCGRGHNAPHLPHKDGGSYGFVLLYATQDFQYIPDEVKEKVLFLCKSLSSADDAAPDATSMPSPETNPQSRQVSDYALLTKEELT